MSDLHYWLIVEKLRLDTSGPLIFYLLNCQLRIILAILDT